MCYKSHAAAPESPPACYKLGYMRVTQIIVIAFLFGAGLKAQAHNELTAEEQKQGYTLLFNGKNLEGWEGDRVLWTVKDGLITGCSGGHLFKVNTFLIYK